MEDAEAGLCSDTRWFTVLLDKSGTLPNPALVVFI